MAIEELVSRIHYVSAIFDIARKIGIHLDISTDFDALRRVDKTQVPGVNVAASFDNRTSNLTSENAFWIRGRDDNGEIVHTQAVKCLNLKSETLDSFMYREVDGFPPPGTVIARRFSQRGLPPDARGICGRACYHGELWIKPGTDKFRGSELTYLLPRLAMGLALTEWSPDFMFGFMFPEHAYKGLSTREGYQHIGPTDWMLQAAGNGEPQEVWITWMSRDDLQYMLTMTPERVLRSVEISRAARRPALVAAE